METKRARKRRLAVAKAELLTQMEPQLAQIDAHLPPDLRIREMMHSVIDYGFTNLTDLEWITSRISQTSGIPLAADIEDGFGGPIAVYRSARRMVMAGAKAIQLEDAGDMEESTELLPREKYYEKVRAALAALDGSDCILIARTNADPATQLDEGIERMRMAHELGAEMTKYCTVVRLNKELKLLTQELGELTERYNQVGLPDTGQWTNQTVRFVRELADMLALAEGVVTEHPDLGGYSQTMLGAFTDGAIALNAGYKALAVVGYTRDGWIPLWHSPDDEFESVDKAAVDRTEQFVWEVLRRLDQKA